MPFEIPENWAWCKPSDVFIINHRNNAEDTIEVGFVPMPLIKDGYHYQHSYESVLWKTVKTGYTHFTNGDFGLAKITPCFENRKSVIFNNLPNGIGAGTTELHILRPIMIDVKYVSYFYSSEEFISYGIKNFSGAVGQQRISKEVIEDFGFALPPQKEQNRIIEAVEKWFSIIDQLEQEQTDLKNAIKRAKSKILDLAIHGKLVPQDPNDEPAIDLLRRINPSFKPCDNAHYKNLPFEIPESWVWVKHNDILEISGGAQPAKSYFSSVQLPNYIRLYQIRDYGDTPIPVYIPIELASKQTRKGDILLARYGGSLGKVFIAEDGAYNVAMAKIIFRYEQPINKDYVYYYYLSDIYQNKLKEISRTAQAGFNSNDFNEMFFPLPPINEQKRVVLEIKKYSELLDNIIAEL